MQEEVPSFLEGNAQLWFLQLETDLLEPSWDEFKRYCNLCFGPPIRSQKLGELAKLRQIGSVANYQEKFEQLVSWAAIEVELHNPLDLATAMSLSRLYESRGQPFSSQLLDGRRSKTSYFSPPQRTSFVRKLTRSEMDERRLKGLCFNCDGVTTPQNMRLQGQLAGNPVVSLVDSGSTNNFVNSKIVSQFNLQVERREGLRIVVANGERVRSSRQCKGVSIWFGPILWDFTDM
ncbi:hypothetical protein KY289_035960 [Solanum tuberosum]|nr:hypothetical protein KY289_035960 [Solanum tuberosum]